MSRRLHTTMRLRPHVLRAVDAIAEDRGLSRTRLVEEVLVAFINSVRRTDDNVPADDGPQHMQGIFG